MKELWKVKKEEEKEEMKTMERTMREKNNLGMEKESKNIIGRFLFSKMTFLSIQL